MRDALAARRHRGRPGHDRLRAQRFDRLATEHIHSRPSAAERLLDEQFLALLEWAAEHPGWHKIGNIDASKRAAELLAKRCLIETWRETQLYRLKPKK